MKKIKNIPPALVLWILAPTLGELLSSSSPPPEFFNPIIFFILALLYGCGAVLIRELIFRWKKGWPSLLMLGIAYGIYEEGIVVRSFFDPAWMDLGNLATYGRVFGVNWVWTEHLIHFHALISIAASITLVEIFYPEKRQRAWLNRRGWILNALGFGVMLPLGRLLSEYRAPLPHLIFSWLAILGLVALARLLPKRILDPRPAVQVPKPRRFWFLGFLGMTVYFFAVYLISEKDFLPFPLTMFLLVIWDLLILWLTLRWSGNGVAWDDRHRFALIAGGLSTFILLSPITESQGQPGMIAVGIFTAMLLFLFNWKLRRRYEENNEKV